MARYKTKVKPKSKRNLTSLWLVLAGLGMVLIAGWAIRNSGSQSNVNVEVKGAPRLKVDKDSIDHGDQKLGNQIQDDIRVTNIGDQLLRFTDAPYVEVKEGC